MPRSWRQRRGAGDATLGTGRSWTGWLVRRIVHSKRPGRYMDLCRSEMARKYTGRDGYFGPRSSALRKACFLGRPRRSGKESKTSFTLTYAIRPLPSSRQAYFNERRLCELGTPNSMCKAPFPSQPWSQAELLETGKFSTPQRRPHCWGQTVSTQCSAEI